MNWVDLVIIIVLVFFTLEGLGRSLFSELFDLLSFLMALLLSLRFYNLAGEYLEIIFSLPQSLANVLGFIAIWYLVEVLLFALASTTVFSYRRVLHLPGSRFLSMIPAFFKGLIFISIVLVLIATFPIQPKIKQTVQDSYLGAYLLDKTYKLESPLKQIFGGLANETLSFLTVYPQTGEKVNTGFETDQFFYDESQEGQMLEWLNQERVKIGLKPLTSNLELKAVARVHAADMFKRGYFSHYSPEGESVADRADKAGVRYLVIGENLAYAPTLELAHQGLMNSPGHRANILSQEYHQVGIGVANGSGYGLMIVQVFSN